VRVFDWTKCTLQIGGWIAFGAFGDYCVSKNLVAVLHGSMRHFMRAALFDSPDCIKKLDWRNIGNGSLAKMRKERARNCSSRVSDLVCETRCRAQVYRYWLTASN